MFKGVSFHLGHPGVSGKLGAGKSELSICFSHRTKKKKIEKVGRRGQCLRKIIKEEHKMAEKMKAGRLEAESQAEEKKCSRK